MYAMVCTHLYLAHLGGVVSRFRQNMEKKHCQALKWMLRYLKGTSDYCLCFGNPNIVLEGLADADMARDVDTRNSTTSYLYTFASVAVSWVSRILEYRYNLHMV